MNLFILDLDPKKIAQYHCDKHIVKMPLESAQMLSTVHRIMNGNSKMVDTYQTVLREEKKFKKTKLVNVLPYESYNEQTKHLICSLYQTAHPSHPVTKWTMRSKENYDFHFKVFEELLFEYERRYKKIHSSSLLLNTLKTAPAGLLSASLTPFALAMPEKYQTSDPVLSYRSYYNGEKGKIAKWNYSKIPDWWEND